MSQSLPRRILLWTASGCLLVGIFLIIGLHLARPLIHHAILETRINGIDFSTCTAAPKTWGWSSKYISIYAYDSLGHSQNPSAPPIEERVLQRVQDERQLIVVTDNNRKIFAITRDVEGPCALIRGTTTGPSKPLVKRLITVLLSAILLSAFLAVIGTFLFVIRPLQARINIVSKNAEHVGSASFVPEPTSADSLGRISSVLAESHTRILKAKCDLEEKNQALECHLAEVAHDLRTPLSSMHLALEALATDSNGATQKEARRALADVVFLSSMVENLHQATRLRYEVDVTSGRVDLSDLVRRIEMRFTIVGRHAGVEVAANTPDSETWVACLPSLAERAVANIVQNAVEHIQEGGHVAIILNLLDGGERFQLSVVDDGSGMPTEILASLQSESFILDDARPRGPGMGMLITQEVARRAEWSVHAYRFRSTNRGARGDSLTQ